MALLVIQLDKHIGNAQAWRDAFRQQLPDLAIRIWPDAGDLHDIEYLAFMHPDFDLLPAFPNLKAMCMNARYSMSCKSPASEIGRAHV